MPETALIDKRVYGSCKKIVDFAVFELFQRLGRDAMLRQGSAVDTIAAFVEAEVAREREGCALKRKKSPTLTRGVSAQGGAYAGRGRQTVGRWGCLGGASGRSL